MRADHPAVAELKALIHKAPEELQTELRDWLRRRLRYCEIQNTTSGEAYKRGTPEGIKALEVGREKVALQALAATVAGKGAFKTEWTESSPLRGWPGDRHTLYTIAVLEP